MNLLRCGPGGKASEAVVERWDHAPRQGRFMRVAAFPLRFGPLARR